MLDNAVRYTPAGGTVTLTISKADGDVAFTVTDTGPGFTPEALHKAGQFLYTDAARPGNGHQGLGLYLARSVAQAYGGKLVLAGAVAAGAAVWACVMANPSGSTRHSRNSTLTPAVRACASASANCGWVAVLGRTSASPSIWMTNATAQWYPCCAAFANSCRCLTPRRVGASGK